MTFVLGLLVGIAIGGCGGVLAMSLIQINRQSNQNMNHISHGNIRK